MVSLLTKPGMVRVILAMMVVVQHLSRFRIGDVAVMVFFILSGYWVMRMFDEKYRSLPRPLLTFYVSRFLRIWLPYATVLLISIAGFTLAFGRYESSAWVALPILGVATHHQDLVGVTWSLDIELQFYLLLPLLWAITTQMRTDISWVALVVSMLALSAGGWALLEQTEISLVAIYLPLFFAGAAIHVLGLHARSWMSVLSVAAFVVAGIAAYLTPDLRQFVIYGTDNPLHNKLFAMLWASTLLPFVAWNVRQPSGSLDRHLGNLSYEIYLVHFPITLAGRELVGRDMTDLEKLVVLVATPLVALVVYLIFGRRFEALRRRLVCVLAPPLTLKSSAEFNDVQGRDAR